MPLPSLRHPAWLMVATIGCLGATLTSAMAGSRIVGGIFLGAAIVLALATGLRFRRLRVAAERKRRS